MCLKGFIIALFKLCLGKQSIIYTSWFAWLADCTSLDAAKLAPKKTQAHGLVAHH